MHLQNAVLSAIRGKGKTMECGRKYIVEQRIRIHTKPLYEIKIERLGTFVRCTKQFFYFKEFRAHQKTILNIKENENEKR